MSFKRNTLVVICMNCFQNIYMWHFLGIKIIRVLDEVPHTLHLAKK